MTEIVVFPREWVLLRAVLRAVIGLACLWSQLLSSRPANTGVTAVAAAFSAYALITLVWRRLDRIQASIAGIFFETAFFVLFASYGTDPGGWLASVCYLYLMLAAAVNHDWGDVFIIVGVCLAFFAFVQSPANEVLRRVVLIAGLVGCVLAYQKRKLQERLADSVRREEMLREEADKIRDLERQRIAGDFHDGPLQSFISLQVRLDILDTLMKRDRNTAQEDLQELRQLARQQVSEVRSFLRSMRPSEVDSNDLATSVRRIVEYFQKDTGITTRFTCSQPSLNLAPEARQEALQILREALTNVQKHSSASRVVVSLEQAGKAIEIAVDDDGKGFAFSGSFTLDELDLLRQGPQSIKRRVRSLGGDLIVESRPGHGASVKIRIPA